MFSDGSSSSESDISTSSGSVCLETDAGLRRCRRRQLSRRESITSVSTNPEEEAYVMVLQNRQGHYDDIKSLSALKDMYDVTFLVGDERKPVEGVRAIISSRSSLLMQLISSFEKNTGAAKNTQISKIKKTITKLNKLSCVHTSRRQYGKRNDVTKKLIIPMGAFDQESFQRFINYVHCGTLTVDASTVIGLLNAAYMFNLPEVQQACWSFALGCMVRTDNLHDLLISARRYADHKMTHELMKTMMEYTKDNPNFLSQSRGLAKLVNTVFRRHELDVSG